MQKIRVPITLAERMNIEIDTVSALKLLLVLEANRKAEIAECQITTQAVWALTGMKPDTLKRAIEALTRAQFDFMGRTYRVTADLILITQFDWSDRHFVSAVFSEDWIAACERSTDHIEILVDELGQYQTKSGLLMRMRFSAALGKHKLRTSIRISKLDLLTVTGNRVQSPSAAMRSSLEPGIDDLNQSSLGCTASVIGLKRGKQIGSFQFSIRRINVVHAKSTVKPAARSADFSRKGKPIRPLINPFAVTVDQNEV